LYLNLFKDKPHSTWLGESEELGPLAISVRLVDKNELVALIRDQRKTAEVHVSGYKNNPIKAILKTCPEICDVVFNPVKEVGLIDDLLKYEKNEVTTKYKFGLLYCKENQVTEESIYNNVITSPDYMEFLSFIGDTVELKGWKKYDGELDCKTDTTGTQSVYTSYQGYEIMFHISTFIPFNAKDPQQLERKRFIGNDIVVLVFKEGTTSFRPSAFRSQFNHIFLVIEKELTSSSAEETFYRISVATKDGIPNYGPDFPASWIFPKGDDFRNFLLCKLINGERSALNHPIFSQKIARTKRIILDSFIQKYTRKPKRGSIVMQKNQKR